jgi:hypothetical protein
MKKEKMYQILQGLWALINQNSIPSPTEMPGFQYDTPKARETQVNSHQQTYTSGPQGDPQCVQQSLPNSCHSVERHIHKA